MKQKIRQISAIIIISLMCSVLAFSQSVADMYIISAQAGGVNLVSGKVSVERKAGKSGILIKGDTLKIGDKVTTGTDGKAEILLNPGSYLRLAENSEFEFTATTLDDLQVKLNRGSAIMEVITHKNSGFIVAVQTPQTKAFIIQSGVYRVDVLNDGTSKFSAWKGRIQIGTGNATLIKGGNFATVKNTQVSVSKFDRDIKDLFDVWSKERAKELMAINAKLEQKTLRNSLLSSFYGRGWNIYDSFGLWVYDRRLGRWCYLPFGSSNSGYGWGYNYNFWDCRIPWQIVQTNPSVIPVKTESSANGNSNAPVQRGDQGMPRIRPVFDTSSDSKGNSDDSKGSSRSDDSNTRGYNPPVYSPKNDTPVYNPPTTRIDPPSPPPSVSLPSIDKPKDN